MVTKDIKIGELLMMDQDNGYAVAEVLMNAGMHCVGCPASQGETIEEAAMVHGIEVDQLVTDINAYFDGLNK